MEIRIHGKDQDIIVAFLNTILIFNFIPFLNRNVVQTQERCLANISHFAHSPTIPRIWEGFEVRHVDIRGKQRERQEDSGKQVKTSFLHNHSTNLSILVWTIFSTWIFRRIRTNFLETYVFLPIKHIRKNTIQYIQRRIIK